MREGLPEKRVFGQEGTLPWKQIGQGNVKHKKREREREEISDFLEHRQA